MARIDPSDPRLYPPVASFRKGNVHAPCVRPLDQGFERSFVEVPQRHRVDLHFESRCAGRSYTVKYDGYVTAACYFLENIGVKRVKRDIDPPHAESCKVGGVLRELCRVDRKRQLLKIFGLEMA
jgi:hypothetical protein